MTRVDMGRPAYAGELSPSTVTLAEVLETAGYTTHMAGKWHLTLDERMAKDAPRDSWPLQRGFDQYYGTLTGGGSYFEPKHLVRGNDHVPTGEALGSRFEAHRRSCDLRLGWNPRLVSRRDERCLARVCEVVSGWAAPVRCLLAVAAAQ